MKKCSLLFYILLPLTSLAQSHFKIKGDIKTFRDGEKVFFSYKEKGKSFNDSTIVKNGVFEFKGTVDKLGVGYLSYKDNPLFADFLHDSANLYVEGGEIFVTAPDSLVHSKITGTPLNNDNTELKFAVMPLWQKLSNETNKFDALTSQQHADVNVSGPIKAAIGSIEREMEPIKIAFIKSHPNSYVSLVTLNRMINQSSLNVVADAYNALSITNKSTALGKTLGQSIAAAQSSQVGVMAANFELPTSNGETTKLSDFKGKYVLVDFWASWCAPCRAENPNVVAAFNKFKDKNFTVLSISIDSSRDRRLWLAAINQDKLPWTQALDKFTSQASVKELYGITSIPANVLIDPDGRIVAKNIKGLELQQTLQNILGN